MGTKKLSPPKLPPLLPHGWKKEVALTLGIHPNTVSRALRSRNGMLSNFFFIFFSRILNIISLSLRSNFNNQLFY